MRYIMQLSVIDIFVIRPKNEFNNNIPTVT
jgi:hypothetical protein